MEMSPDIVAETSRYMQKVYFWMFLGLLLSGTVALFTYNVPAVTDIVFGNGLVFYGLLIFQLMVVGGLVLFIKRIPAVLGILTFLFYCLITGMTLSVIFFVYEITSIGLVFFIAAAMFAFMSIYGYFTKTDLTSIGQVLIMGLFGVVITSIANIFLQNSAFDFVISIIGVIVFTGLTAYDTQKIKEKNILGNEGTEEDTKEAVMGALTLYLDFINLFLQLLKLFGKRKR